MRKIKKLIDKYEYISFDIFDTLLKRNVSNPTYIYDIMELNNTSDNMNCFSKKRKDAEFSLWNESHGATLNINNIYDRIDNIDKEKVLKYEQELEANMICANSELLEIYNYCISKNKKIILISDMYHTKKFLEKILKENGINNYYKLYVSSECKCTKSEGTLFEYVKRDLNSSSILHIGDSLKSDFIMPKLKGLNSHKINRYINRLRYQKSLDNVKTLGDDILYSLTNNNIINIENDYQKIGYEALGNLLVGFSYWIYNECKNRKIKTILFLSRDGFIMKNAFDILFKSDDIKTQYFLASRRSLTVPMLTDIKCFSEILDIIKFRKKETFSSMLKRVGISNLHEKDISIADSEIDRDEILKDKKLLSKFNEYLDEIKSNAENECESFIKYFKENVTDDDIAIVDIGWHGTMQDCLNILLKKNGINCSINGFYIGLSEKSTSEKHNYAFDCENEKYNFNFISAFRGLIETFFAAYHGSAQKYYMDKDKPTVLMEEYNIPSETLEIIKEIHSGALKNVVDFSKLSCYTKNICVTPEYSFSSLYKLMTKPTKYDINKFENVLFFDTEYRKLIDSKGCFYYLFHVKQFVKDFINCDWRIGFLKKTFSIINIPDKLVLFIYKFKK